MLYNVFEFVAEIFYSKRCAICRKDVYSKSAQSLCSTCWEGFDFITDPACEYCGQCADFCICSKTKKHVSLFVCALKYNNAATRIISRFKYKDCRNLAPLLGTILYQRIRKMAREIDIWMPVPLHKNRMRVREYNQSAILLNAIRKLAQEDRSDPVKILCSFDLLKRKIDNVQQASLTKKERIKNMNGVFNIDIKSMHKIEGKRVCILDDVITTGSTVQECAKVLRNAGAEAVVAISVAKT